LNNVSGFIFYHRRVWVKASPHNLIQLLQHDLHQGASMAAEFIFIDRNTPSLPANVQDYISHGHQARFIVDCIPA
jgi:hypothetical protein